MAKENLILEVGLEEVPAHFMPPALSQLKELTEAKLAEERLTFDSVKTYGTPRRIVLIVEGMSDKQGDLAKEVRGPAKKAAYDESGKPSKALQGFMRSQGVTEEALEVRQAGNAEYIFAKVEEKGAETKAILPDLLPGLLTAINWPKNMRWADCELRFVRPIKWILALYAGQTVPFELAGVKSGNTTLGHRFLSQGELTVKDIADYKSKLAENYVVVDQNEREKMIVEDIKRVAKEQNGEVIIDEELLTEVVYLVEYPTALYGSFSEEYLVLPPEVLITSMKEHQRYFPVVKADGKLLNGFITVRNGTDAYLDLVREGNERVLRARLADAIFFYEEDQKVKLEAEVPKLKSLLFQEGMGSVYDKTERLVKLVEKLGQEIGRSEDELTAAKRAAYLAKADLVTNMVKEFTELQGVMGQEYSRLSGETAEVAKGIFEHYLPRFAGDELPETIVGRLVGLADKIDTLAACFALKLIPTGSQDPYALRRQANGIVYILLNSGLRLTLTDLIDAALSFIPEDNMKLTKAETRKELLEFFRQRLKNFFMDKGIKYDIVDAVMEVRLENVSDLWLRAQKVQEFLEDSLAESLLAAFTRVDNLAKKAKAGGAGRDLLQDICEQQLFDAFIVIRQEVGRSINNSDYLQAMTWLSKLRIRIDAFLEESMVMVDDLQVRNNRLALLKDIHQEFLRIADFAKIVRD